MIWKVGVVIIAMCFFSGTGAYGQTANPQGGMDRKDCNENGPAFPPQCSERMKWLYSEIQRLVGQASCSESFECKTFGAGAKLCGGPGGYIAYSTRSSDENALMKNVEEYNRLSRDWASYLSRTKRLASDCSVVTDPGAVCQESQCVLRSRAVGR